MAQVHTHTPPQGVVAIDIGSDGCGYGFSADYHFKINPCDIFVPRWSVEGVTSLKTPAAILFDARLDFKSFGYTAQNEYADICASNDQNNWYYVRGFKMALYDAVESGEDIRSDFEIREMGGKSLSAKKIFSSAIKFLHDHFMTQLDDKNLGIDKKRIQWVLTVPAIWTDSCKQFMRESGIEAGIPGHQLVLVLEPEAASVYARLLQVDKEETEEHQIILKTFKPGTKMLVIDAGGGTVDISAQEVLEENQLKIIHKVRGGDYGGKSVNMAYREMLVKLFSGPTLITLKKKYSMYYMEMMRSFEEKKKTFKLKTDKEVSVRLSAPLLDISEDNSGYTIHDLIENSVYCGKLRVKRDRLFIASDIFKGFFENSMRQLLATAEEIFQHERCTDATAIMLVGGYAECDILSNAVKTAFPEKDVFVPHEGGFSVLKGAVIFGHTPQVVTSRICDYTYGFSISEIFEEGMLVEKMYTEYDDTLMCGERFKICFQIDSVVNVGDKKEIPVRALYRRPEDQVARVLPVRIEIFISENKIPEYVTDDGCRLHAIITIPPPNKLWPEEVHGRVEFEIAGTDYKS